MDTTAWRLRGRYLAGLPVLALMGFNAFVRGVRVPLLGWIDLAIHEAGHVLAFPLPDIGMAVMGSGLQVLVPVLLAGVFWLHEQDVLGTSLCLGWAGTSFQDASVYIADAPYQTLPLLGGGEHDWAWVLGPRGLDQLGAADELARISWTVGLVLWGVGVGLCLAGPRLARAIGAGHRDIRPWALWARADVPPPLDGAPPALPGSGGPARRVPSGRDPDPHPPPPTASGLPNVAGSPADGTERPDHPPDTGPGAAGGVDPGGSGDAARARVIW